MPTSFDEIIDLALITIDDYKLRKLYDLSSEQFQTYCDGFLISAIPNFYRCRHSLEFIESDRTFVEDLSLLEKKILADLYGIEWARNELQNAAQLRLKLQVPSSFKNHSSAQHIKELSSYIRTLEIDVDLKFTNYELQNIEALDI